MSERVHEALSEFVRVRDWAQFHTPANLAKSISIEAGELLECFQWSDDADELRVREELADVVTSAHCSRLDWESISTRSSCKSSPQRVQSTP